ncbi:MAG: ATP-binding cassette domain-containing protein [Propionibacteriaceae bacterium]|jgi:ABC-type lipoprotein export system ATPase subunit|nr:ATP-binding cassette domain-containing protein [Propionibacteriaceae bacterium]
MESSANPPDRLVTLDGVGHWFPGTAVLFDDLCASFSPGRITGVCGPSGCGKSTLLTLIAGWERPRRGTITKIGVLSVVWVFQNPHGVARRTALDHVAFPLLAQGESRREASEIALDIMCRFGLEEIADRPFSTISGGEAQRLLLARALAVDPDVLLVDEPTAQLDRQSAVTVNENLGLVASGGAIVIVATHDPATQAACDAIIDLGANAGRVGGGS